MEIWILIPFFIVLGLGLLLTSVGLFGNIVVFGSIVGYAILTGFWSIGFKELLILGILYGTGELLEYVFTMIGVRWLGASRLAGWMAILGTIAGAMVGGAIFWVVGVVAGGFIGAILGALITELIIKGNIGLAFKAGLGAFLGKTGSIFVKLVIAVIMIMYVLRIISYRPGI